MDTVFIVGTVVKWISIIIVTAIITNIIIITIIIWIKSIF